MPSCRGRQSTVPAWCVEDLISPDVHSHAAAPTAVCSEEDFGSHALTRYELVGRHQLHGGARKNLLAAMPAFVQHHPAEEKIVINGRDEPAAVMEAIVTGDAMHSLKPRFRQTGGSTHSEILL